MQNLARFPMTSNFDSEYL